MTPTTEYVDALVERFAEIVRDASLGAPPAIVDLGNQAIELARKGQWDQALVMAGGCAWTARVDGDDYLASAWCQALRGLRSICAEVDDVFVLGVPEEEIDAGAFDNCYAGEYGGEGSDS